MKRNLLNRNKAILLLLMVLSGVCLKAQNNVSFSDNSIWSEVSQYAYPIPDTTYYQYGILGDTVINDLTYKKVYLLSEPGLPIQGDFFAAIRENESKVFAIISDSAEHAWEFNIIGEEILLYDFSKSVGDTMNYNFGDFFYDDVITRIDSIEINGEYRKTFNLGLDYWIEGIGSTQGLFYPLRALPIARYSYVLICFNNNGDVHYLNPDFDTCYSFMSLSEDSADNSAVQVAPNPGNNVLNIRTSLQNASVEIYDIQGKIIYKQDITENITAIPTERWNSGMYLWKVYNKGKEVENGKWVKQ